MTIGILETGAPPGDLAERFGRYDAMMARLIGPDFATRTYDVCSGQWPERPEACAGYIVTGSAAGVYDDLPWIDPLIGFLQEAKGRAKLVGICFGHQIMAQAFGGTVVKSDKGWGIGLHEYRIADRAPWMDGEGAFAIPASHQDQVVQPPPHAKVIVSSDFAPYAGLSYQDQPAISLQGHPEFSAEFTKALLGTREKRLDPELYRSAVASLDRPNDNGRVARWIRAFLAGDGGLRR